MGDYRFLRSRGGVTSFALVGIQSRPGATWQIHWDGRLAALSNVYGAAVRQGVMAAAHEHEFRGGSPQTVDVVSLIETASDTRPDAVECAAALAAWTTWGHPEAEARVEWLHGRWKVSFGHGA
jgi:hypothetical protein